MNNEEIAWQLCPEDCGRGSLCHNQFELALDSKDATIQTLTAERDTEVKRARQAEQELKEQSSLIHELAEALEPFADDEWDYFDEEIVKMVRTLGIKAKEVFTKYQSWKDSQK